MTGKTTDKLYDIKALVMTAGITAVQYYFLFSDMMSKFVAKTILCNKMQLSISIFTIHNEQQWQSLLPISSYYR